LFLSIDSILSKFQDEFVKYETVLIIDVHNRDMIEVLIRDGICEPSDL